MQQRRRSRGGLVRVAGRSLTTMRALCQAPGERRAAAAPARGAPLRRLPARAPEARERVPLGPAPTTAVLVIISPWTATGQASAAGVHHRGQLLVLLWVSLAVFHVLAPGVGVHPGHGAVVVIVRVGGDAALRRGRRARRVRHPVFHQINVDQQFVARGCGRQGHNATWRGVAEHLFNTAGAPLQDLERVLRQDQGSIPHSHPVGEGLCGHARRCSCPAGRRSNPAPPRRPRATRTVAVGSR